MLANAHQNTPAVSPALPGILALPLFAIPGIIQSTLFTKVANAILAFPIKNGELDFLRHRTISIQAQDAGVRIAITIINNKLAASPIGTRHDLSIQGNLYDLLLLISRREDSDTLFFQRRLRMEGDTELGLEIKNFLDSLDADVLKLVKPLNSALQKALPLYERLFG
ncbi:MAG: SCP2 sterol-binding domain-containing protein [Gammaproteobacteria bacterium]